MKPNRPLMIAILTVVVAVGTCILLNGCASTGDGKTTEPKEESSQQIDKQGSVVEEVSKSSSEARQEPVATTGSSGEKQHGQELGRTADEDLLRSFAASLSQALDRILPGTLSEMNWNRIATILVGILMMAMVYGLAFVLARWPLRKRGAGSHGSGRRTGQGAGETISQ